MAVSKAAAAEIKRYLRRGNSRDNSVTALANSTTLWKYYYLSTTITRIY